MLYSKLGSIPKLETDGTDGWIEVPEPPVAPEGKEVVWWYPPGWVVRDPKPEDTETSVWNWSQTEEKWVETLKVVSTINLSVESDDIINMSSATAATASESVYINTDTPVVLDFGTASPQ